MMIVGIIGTLVKSFQIFCINGSDHKGRYQDMFSPPVSFGVCLRIGKKSQKKINNWNLWGVLVAYAESLVQ